MSLKCTLSHEGC